ncbi:phosphatase PAP2 family protein [Acidisoma sp. C75]
MHRKLLLASALLGGVLPLHAMAQTAPNLAAIRGLAPIEALPNTADGKAALGANFAVTRSIATGEAGLPLPLPFPEQQRQALRDAFITSGNLAGIADGLGTTLDGAYEARAHYTSPTAFTNLSPAVHRLIAYALALTHADAGAGKYFFANGTLDGKDAASDAASSLMRDMRAEPDVFGRAYGHPAGSAGAGHFGNARPFLTITGLPQFTGHDYFNAPADNTTYTRGPMADLVNSPSFPSGHTTYAFTGALILSLLVPERYPQLMARAAEYGDDRIILGAHYAMDVIAGRTLATYDIAQLLAQRSLYLALPLKGAPPLKDIGAAVQAARDDARTLLASACGGTIAACAAADHGRFDNLASDGLVYAATLSYGLPVVFPKTAMGEEDVGKLAPEAGYLLTAAFPTLSLTVADQILTETEAPGGGFLDNGTPFGVYSRLNLFAAAERAEALTAAPAAQTANPTPAAAASAPLPAQRAAPAAAAP